MNCKKFLINANIWLYPGENASWHFLTIPKKESSTITEKFKSYKKGWGSFPVRASIGKTIWETSIFPDRKSGTYLLPIKASVRRSEGLEAGDKVRVKIMLLV